VIRLAGAQLRGREQKRHQLDHAVAIDTDVIRDDSSPIA